MYCRYCGSPVAETARFCESCGAPTAEPYADQWSGACEEYRPFHSYLVWNIIATVLCFAPLGAVGIFFSYQARTAWNEGRYDRAYDKADWASTAFWTSAAVGIAAVFARTVWTFPELLAANM